ncbi:MAG: hypothetical protein MHPSP_000426, partial [Paramarteilia canceri]
MGKFDCIDPNNADDTCAINGQTQCTDIDKYFDENIKKIWSEIRKSQNFNDSYMSPSFKVKVEDECT